MGEATALPGWGRAKRTSGHRVDVARSRVESQLHSRLPSGDTLVWQAAYAPFQWGKLPSSLTFSDEAASFPRSGVRWLGTQGLSCAAHVARWTGTERSPDGGSTESLFRQSDALWTQAQWQGRPLWNVGLLSGMVKARPWTGELAQDSTGAFAWKPWASAVAAWTSSNGQLSFAGEWTTHQGWGLGTTWAASKTLTCAASVTRLSGMTDAGWAMQHAGTPVSAVLDLFGSETLWRVELHGRWTRDRLHIQSGRPPQPRAWRGRGWIGWTLQPMWPLRALAGGGTVARRPSPLVARTGHPPSRRCVPPHGHDARVNYLWRTMTSLMLPAGVGLFGGAVWHALLHHGGQTKAPCRRAE